MTRAVIYARVSSQSQRDRHTIASQLRVLPEYVAAQGWTLARPAETYVDDGRTAKAGHLEEREAFTRLLVDAAAKAFEIVVVVDVDRLTRSEDMIERAAILGAFQRAGVRVATPASGPLDLNTMPGELQVVLRALFAAEENRVKRERTVRGKLEAIHRGRKPAGPTPYGLRYERAAGAWSICEAEAAIVGEINRRVQGGESCESIGRDLESRGIPAGRGGSWPRERVWSIATNSTYRGQWIADKARRLVVTVPRILSDADWYAAQDRLAQTGRRGLRRTKHVYLCEAIGVCALCGGRIGIATHGQAGRDRAARKAYYVCGRRRRPARSEAPCVLPFRDVAEVDERLWRAIAALIEAPGRLEAALRRRRASAASDEHDWAADLRDYEGKLRRHERACAVILAEYRRGRISEATMRIEQESAARERALLERQVATARAQAAQARDARTRDDSLSACVEDLRRRLSGATETDRRDLVRAVVGEGRVVLGERSIKATLIPSSLAPARDTERVAGSSGPHVTALRIVA